MHPASHVRIPYDSSKFIILFIFLVLMTTSSCNGTDPPTSPVLPPYGTTANLLSLQYLRHSEICSVVDGVITIDPIPTYLFVKSLTKGAISSFSLMTFASPTIDEN